MCAGAHACLCVPQCMYRGAGRKVILLLFVVTFRPYSSMQRHQGSYRDKTCVPLTLILQLCHSPLAEECSPLLMSLATPPPPWRQTLGPNHRLLHPQPQPWAPPPRTGVSHPAWPHIQCLLASLPEVSSRGSHTRVYKSNGHSPPSTLSSHQESPSSKYGISLHRVMPTKT